MKLFTAILAAWVSGVAGKKEEIFAEDGAGNNFVKVHVTGKELLRLCVKTTNAAFAELHPETFKDTKASHPPESFLSSTERSPDLPQNVYAECLKFMDSVEVPRAQETAFNKLKELLKASSNPPMELWQHPPTMRDIAYPTVGVFRRVLKSGMSVMTIRAIAVLSAANEVSTRNSLKTPLAVSIVAKVEFFNGVFAPRFEVEKGVTHMQNPAAMAIMRNCIKTVGKAIQEATGVDMKKMNKMINGYTKAHTRGKSFNHAQEITDGAFNTCFNFTDELGEVPGLFNEAQKIKIAETQAKVIFLTHPNMEIADDATGMSEALAEARLGVQAARSIVGVYIIGSDVSRRVAHDTKIRWNWFS